MAASQQAESQKTAELIWAASTGDLETMYRLVAQGVPLGIADYDLRTPLHLAAAEGHVDVVKYLVAHRVDLQPRDRWGNTPLDDAVRHGRTAVAAALKHAGDGVRRAPPAEQPAPRPAAAVAS